MRDYDRRDNTAEHSRFTIKRRRLLTPEQSADDDEQSQRQDLLHPPVETLTLKPHRSLVLPTSWSSSRNTWHTSSSSRQRRRQRQRRRGKERILTSVEREWVFSSSDFTNHKDKVVVVSYNLLGVENTLSHTDLYFNVLPKYLEWDRRKHLICKEIGSYNASILCLQEVDRFDDLDALLQKDGFRGVHKSRTGEAFDGCTIFWREKLFKLLHHQDVEFERFGLRKDVAQLCVLEMNREDSESKLCARSSRLVSTGSRRLVVGNIHVLFSPKRGDVKLGQVRLLLERAYKLSQEWGNIPVVIAGDINCTPKSAMYEFIASAELDTQLHDRRKISGQFKYESNWRIFRSTNYYAASPTMSISRSLSYEWSDEELRLATGSDATTHVRHPLKLCSAYAGVPGTSRTRDHLGEPLATSHHSRFLGTVDYIWHTEELVPVRVLETLPIDVLKRTGGLPSEKWGSDHLAIACEFAFGDGGQ